MNTRIRTFIAISIGLFFLQAIRVVFSTLFGFIVDQIFTGTPDLWLPISNILVLLAFIAPIFSKRFRTASSFAVLAALARVLLSINEIHVRFGAALVVLAAAGLYLGALLHRSRPRFLKALFGAFALDLLLRTLGDTYDLGMRPWWIPVQIVWALALLWAVRSETESEVEQGGVSAFIGLAIGCVLFVESSVLGLPNAIARWSGISYALVAPVLFAITALPLTGEWWWSLGRRLNGARVGLGLLLALFLLGGYFMQGIPAALLLLLAQVLVMLILTILLSRDQQGSGTPLVYGLLFLLLMNFYNAFSFTYSYTLSALRDLGWIAYLMVGAVITLALFSRHQWSLPVQGTRVNTAAVLGGAVVLAATVILVLPQQVENSVDADALRFSTYNIHYGYDGEWKYMLEEQAKAIEESGADVVALQEVDTGRLTSYGVDNAYFLARRLKMHVEYLPTVEHLTGIAVLYRGDASAISSEYLTSIQEQTGIIAVELANGVTCFGVWLGLSNEDTLGQIDEALRFIGETDPACFGGDFNAEADSELVEKVKAAGFVDPFETLGIEPAPPTSPAENPVERIDYVFIRGLVPIDAWVPIHTVSDHRQVVVEVGLFQ
jgi:endonuclease/exonuclease/phosphatase family metal-dependent hydrolase